MDFSNRRYFGAMYVVVAKQKSDNLGIGLPLELRRSVKVPTTAFVTSRVGAATSLSFFGGVRGKISDLSVFFSYTRGGIPYIFGSHFES